MTDKPDSSNHKTSRDDRHDVARTLASAGRGREQRIATIKATYTNPVYLVKRHKDLIKELRSLEQGRNGHEVACVFCRFVMPNDQAQVNHINGDRNDHRLENLEPACQKCNLEDRKKRHAARFHTRLEGERESTHGADGVAQLPKIEYSNREGAKHEVMRQRFNAWLRDQTNGAFANRHSWNRELLAERAPYACSSVPGDPLGSSKTYRKYIGEDIGGGILKAEIVEGETIVYLNKEYLDSLAKKSGQ